MYISIYMYLILSPPPHHTPYHTHTHTHSTNGWSDLFEDKKNEKVISGSLLDLFRDTIPLLGQSQRSFEFFQETEILQERGHFESKP